ncbi:MAG: DUF3108 domain-containing protein [Gemmatimonadota bacterium]
MAAPPPVRESAETAPSPVPVRVGEKLHYAIHYGFVRAGKASLDVIGVDTVRGREAYHIRFAASGGIVFYHVNDQYDSWVDARSGVSLRYEQRIREGRYASDRRFEIFPDSATYLEMGKESQPGVAEPLDEVSFFYVLRSLGMTEGATYTLQRYFRPENNPVVIRVLRRERIEVPAGAFDAVVLQPVIQTRKGAFSEKGDARVWVSDDPRHVILKVESRLFFGSLSMRLTAIDSSDIRP